jgi:hypothetical protein
MATYNRAHPRPNPVERIIGIDGEGQTDATGAHYYTYLAAADEEGETWECVGTGDGGRVTTEQAFEFLLGLPNRALIFGFAFLYDLTKWFEDLPDRSIYLLMHEKRRLRLVDGKVIYRAVRWRGYSLNFMNRRFSLARREFDQERGCWRTGARRTLWDIFAFFQSKFVKALADWQIGTEEERAQLSGMKDRRGGEAWQDGEEVRAYCRAECAKLALLGRQLIVAHEDADLKLTSYFGAGSTASVLLKSFGVRELRGEIPEAMREAIACAFFGGRFENSCIGPVRRRAFNDDISSAYPYHSTFLPCLLHGKWRRVRKVAERDLERARLALVHWRIRSHRKDDPWGVLPVRKADGTIAFPLEAPQGGWTWREEFLAARAYNPAVEATEAWVYETGCDCRPFGRLPWYYLERCRIGKEGRGIVFKLGPNSVYGKLAQSKGVNPPYQSWVWAGNITSGCRAQLLEGLKAARDPANVLMFATDGIWSTEKLQLPAPRDTGTESTGKPLGGWETKEFPRGVFCVRPGIYFPLEPTEDELEKVRARGLGRKVLYENWESIARFYEEGYEAVEIEGAARFVGARSGITWSPRGGCRRSPHYGRWVPYAVRVGFDPRPKRSHALADGTLVPWASFNWPSMPYEEATKSPEASLLALATQMIEEQPDADYTEVE